VPLESITIGNIFPRAEKTKDENQFVNKIKLLTLNNLNYLCRYNMIEFYNDKPLLFRSELVNKTLNWYSTDSKDLFKQQSKDFKKNHEHEIVYKFNSLGHRTKEISDLNRDFLLTFGCSYTEGVGLNTDKIWNDRVSKDLKLDLYNCALEASGMDVQYYNATLWKNSKLPIPKLVIVQWPQKARKQFGLHRHDHIELRDMTSPSTKDGVWWGRRYLLDVGEMYLNNFMWFENFNNIWQSMNVPVLNFTWDDDDLEVILKRSKYKIWAIVPDTLDKARDNGHDGPEFHRGTAEQLLEIMKLPNFTYKI